MSIHKLKVSEICVKQKLAGHLFDAWRPQLSGNVFPCWAGRSFSQKAVVCYFLYGGTFSPGCPPGFLQVCSQPLKIPFPHLEDGEVWKKGTLVGQSNSGVVWPLQEGSCRPDGTQGSRPNLVRLTRRSSHSPEELRCELVVAPSFFQTRPNLQSSDVVLSLMLKHVCLCACRNLWQGFHSVLS